MFKAECKGGHEDRADLQTRFFNFLEHKTDAGQNETDHEFKASGPKLSMHHKCVAARLP